VPFAEYVPDRPFWYSLAPSLIGLIQRGFDFGTHSGVFRVAGVHAGSLICFEIAIDDLPHQLVSEGAQVILSQANNADFGHTDETFQQEALARLQAIATGRSIVHVSTVGVTEVIRPDGSVSAYLKPFTRGYLIQRVALKSDLTPAMRFYGWVDDLALATAALVLVWFLASHKRRRDFLKANASLG
jgi:apolipoprotein N-acyltransferase